MRTHQPGGRALPSAPRPRCPQARAGGAVKQRKPAANDDNASRTATTIEALLDIRRLAALPGHEAFTPPTGQAEAPFFSGLLERTSRSPRGASFAGELADHNPALLIGERQDVAHLLEQPAFVRVGRAAVVDDQGRPVGVVSLTDIQRTIRAARLRSSASDLSRLMPR